MKISTTLTSGGRGAVRRLGMSVGIMLGAVSILSVSGLAAAGQAPHTGAALAQQYIAALSKAGTSIAKVQGELKGLPLSASTAQVQRVVAALPPALSPLETLLQPTGSTACSHGGTPVEDLGTPTTRTTIQGAGVVAGTYRSAADGAVLDVGGQVFSRGFVVTEPNPSTYLGPAYAATFTWKLSRAYTGFTAQLGLEPNSGVNSIRIEIRGAGGSVLPVIVGGHTVTAILVTKAGLTTIHATFVDRTFFGMLLPPPASGAGYAVAVANDCLS